MMINESIAMNARETTDVNVLVRPEGLATATIDKARIVTLPKLIELKLASGMTNRARLRDLADVQDLIATLNLDERMAEHLDPYVRSMYLDLLQAIRTDRRPEE